MEQPCYKCGQAVEQGVAFCPHCSAPQIRVMVAEPLVSEIAGGPSIAVPPTSDLTMGMSATPAGTLRWRQAFSAAAAAGLPAGLGMILVGLFGVWMVVAGVMSVFLYRRRTRDIVRPGAGARLGALSAILAFSLFCLVTVPTGFFRIMMTELMHRYSQQSDASVRAMAEGWLELLKTPAGQAIWLVCLLFFLLAAAAIGGAIGGLLMRGPSRPKE